MMFGSGPQVPEKIGRDFLFSCETLRWLAVIMGPLSLGKLNSVEIANHPTSAMKKVTALSIHWLLFKPHSPTG